MKFFIDNIFLFGSALISGGALLLPSLLRRGAKVSTLKATQLINQGQALILDVRAAEDFSSVHVREAKNISLPDLSSKITEIEKFKLKPVIVICQSGVLSSKATMQLQSAGFTQAFSLEGGLAAWLEQGLPVVKQ